MQGMRFFVNVIYTFRFRYSLATRAFTETESSVVCSGFPISSKFYFSQ